MDWTCDRSVIVTPPWFPFNGCYTADQNGGNCSLPSRVSCRSISINGCTNAHSYPPLNSYPLFSTRKRRGGERRGSKTCKLFATRVHAILLDSAARVSEIFDGSGQAKWHSRRDVIENEIIIRIPFRSFLVSWGVGNDWTMKLDYVGLRLNRNYRCELFHCLFIILSVFIKDI